MSLIDGWETVCGTYIGTGEEEFMIIGAVRGESIEPLHPKVPEACLKDSAFHEYMALCDALRVGRAREKNMAIQELRNRLC